MQQNTHTHIYIYIYIYKQIDTNTDDQCDTAANDTNVYLYVYICFRLMPDCSTIQKKERYTVVVGFAF